MNFWKQQRERIGKTQQEIADSIEKTKALVSAWECDRALPSLAMSEQLSRAYRISREDFRIQVERHSKRLKGSRSKKEVEAVARAG